MVRYVTKRDGRVVDFDPSKIEKAILSAMRAINDNPIDVSAIISIANNIKNTEQEVLNIEKIQDLVEDSLMEAGFKRTAKAYILYRAKKAETRNKGWEMTDLQRDILQNKYIFENEGFNGFIERVGYQNTPIQKMIREKKIMPNTC